MGHLALDSRLPFQAERPRQRERVQKLVNAKFCPRCTELPANLIQLWIMMLTTYQNRWKRCELKPLQQSDIRKTLPGDICLIQQLRHHTGQLHPHTEDESVLHSSF